MSPILKVISTLQFGPWKSQKLRLGPFPLPPARLPALFFSAGCRRHCAAPPARRGEPVGPSASRWRQRVAPELLHRPWPRADAPSLRHAAQSRRTVATSPSPWPGQGRGRRLLLARARALQEPQNSIPLALLHSPRSHAPERHRRSTPNAGELKPPSNPLLRTSPPLIDPATRSASPSCS